MNDEKSVLVRFEGWDVDIFLCDNGSLGMTVNKSEAPEDEAKDIYVGGDGSIAHD